MVKIAEKVVLLNTGELFNNIVEASKAKGISYNKIYDSAHRRSRYASTCNGEKLIWRFKNEYDSISKDQIENLLAEVNNIGGKIDGNGAVWVSKSKHNLLRKEDKERLLNYKGCRQVIDIYSGKIYKSLDELRVKMERSRIQLFHLADTSIPLVYGSDKIGRASCRERV